MTTQPPTARPRVRLTFVTLWLLTSLLVWLTPTHYLTADAVNNLEYLYNGDRFELWHGQHLLALWPGYVVDHWTDFSTAPTVRGNGYAAMRLAHAVLAGATVATFFLALDALIRERRVAALVAAALLFSYGFWHYASDPDIYMAGYAANALLLLAFVRALRAPTTTRVLLLGLAASLALLTHQMNVEIAGLIGLALIGLALRRGPIPIRWTHVVVYAAASLGPTLLLYVIGWRDVSVWLVAQGESAPGFVDWALRYFSTAQSGAATWGVTLSPSTLPVAAYAFVQSWVLPPPRLDALAVLILGLLALGGVAFAVHFVTLARRLSPVERVVAAVCLLSLLANAVSGWWWQAGNIKFYLFMQLYLLVLVALYARVALTSERARRLRVATLAALGVGLALAHLLLALPYETHGGVFRLAALYGDDPDATLYIEDEVQDRAIKYVSLRSSRGLSPQDCIMLPSYDDNRPGRRRIWVLSAERAATCALDGATYVDSYYADRARTEWQVWDVTAITTPAE